MTKRDYYEVLGLGEGATKDEIKRIYRRLAKEHHPDMNKDNTKEAEEKFKEISEAYAVLSDDEKRARYDRFGHAGLRGFSSEDIFGGADLGEILRDLGFGGGGLGSIFDAFFGGGGGYQRNRRTPSRGSDLRYDLELTLEDAAFGLDTTIEIPRWVRCEPCEGSGAEPGTEKETCSTCQGSGQIRTVRRTAFGHFTSINTCDKCQGYGKVIKNPCEECDGAGKIRKLGKINVKVPEGVDTGSRLRVGGEGEAGHLGGPPGDLYVVLHVKSHDLFERYGNDIICEVPISISQAALGDEIEVPTLDGEEDKVKISAGTQTDTIFKLKGKGIPNLRGFGRGDQHVKVRVVTPTNLSEKQKALLREFAKLSGEEAGHKTFFGKIKDGVRDAI
ncbi:MAG: molecular chaperone DnaJ [Halobacteriota archaeon]|nr:molecular chaperone DnaJ [Halobacteriota archaeon]